MPDKANTKDEKALSQSGMMPRVTTEPNVSRESKPRPTTLPEQIRDSGATTGIMPAVGESEDKSAARDEDHADGQ